MGERLLCKQEVIGSIPFTSTTDRMAQSAIRVERGSGALAPRERGAGKADRRKQSLPAGLCLSAFCGL